ncbi:MAG: hypothetical protein IPQ07_00195 [Myxococcales bacterium]|nr:hypothetical protein [Myxococcales bacterium]
MLRKIVLVSVALATAPPAMAGPCAIEPFGPVPISNGTVAIVEGGGVIVAQEIGGFGRGNTNTAAEQPGWRFKDVNTLKRPQIKTLAPGLAVYQLPAGGGGTLTLVDDDGKTVFSFKRALAARDELPAPKLRKVTAQTSVATSPRSVTSSWVTATFEPAPADAVILVVYDVSGTAGPVALSWGRVTGGAKDSVVYQSGGRCRPSIPGLVSPSKGGKVQLAWVDSSGRVSPMSKPIKVN